MYSGNCRFSKISVVFSNIQEQLTMKTVHRLNILYFDVFAIQDDKQTHENNSFCFLTCLEYFVQSFAHCLSFFRYVARNLENSTSSERFLFEYIV